MTAPRVREPLPRASEASCDPDKWSGWILAADRGHGSDWEAVFKLGLADADQLWEVLSAVIANVPVSAIRDLGHYGLNCEVAVRLQIHGRTASVTRSGITTMKMEHQHS